MWFTKVSLRNPVFATMLMMALVVLGLFSLQRLKIDQFPNIDFPVVVVTTDYPGASPEIVEAEVSKKIEESVNSIAGINALTSRSLEGTSIVTIEFQLHVNGRKAADDVREKVAAVRPQLRTEVKEPRVLRFDPSSRSIWSLAVLPDPATAGPSGVPNAVAMTQWADQVLKKRLENVRGVGAVNLVGASRREIQIQLKPQAMNALGISSDQVAQAVKNENQDFPLGRWRPAARGHGALQRPTHLVVDGAKGSRREHHRRHRRAEQDRGEFARAIARRPELGPHLRWFAHDPGLGQQRAAHFDRRRHADGLDRLFIPQLLAFDRHHGADAADCHHRLFPLHARLGIHHQHGDLDGLVAVRGLAHR